MAKKTVRDIEVADKRVLVRVDFNVPLDEETGVITDDSRIRCIGSDVEKAAAALGSGGILLLENVRFHPEEESNDAPFARALSRLADIYVNDAFGTAHRNHASVVGVARYLPAVAGLLLEKEIESLGSILEKPAKPFVVILGGAKITDKVAMIQNIMHKVDCILIGGGMAATFLKAKSYEVGQSLLDDMVATAASLMDEAKNNSIPMILPLDVVATERISHTANGNIVPVDSISSKESIVDIGPQTIKIFTNELQKSRTAFWNGPMGVCEISQFARGTLAITGILADMETTTVIGGGSTSEIVTKSGLAGKMTFVSTGGGASLKFLAGKVLPGVEALLDNSA